METATQVSQAPDVGVSQTEATSSSFSVPEEYAQAGWAEGIQSYDDLWKMTANAQSLIGKRPAGIPTQDAPSEEWDKFYTAMGRPESPDLYKLNSEFEGLPEGIDISEYEGKAKQFFHKLGLSPAKAQEAWNDYIGMELEALQRVNEQSSEKTKNLDAEFEKLTQELWGDKYEQVSKQAQDFIAQSLPESLKGVVSEVANNPRALAVLIKVAESAQTQISQIKQKYGAEDKLVSGTQAPGMSQEEIVKRLTEENLKARSAEPFSQERKAAEMEAEKLRSMLAKFYK